MRIVNEAPDTGWLEWELDRVLARPVPSGRRARVGTSASVRELERRAVSCRLAGDRLAAEETEDKILMLLEQKITCKLLAQGRQRRRLKRETAA